MVKDYSKNGVEGSEVEDGKRCYADQDHSMSNLCGERENRFGEDDILMYCS
jgi:hypothetical protein